MSDRLKLISYEDLDEADATPRLRPGDGAGTAERTGHGAGPVAVGGLRHPHVLGPLPGPVPRRHRGGDGDEEGADR